MGEGYVRNSFVTVDENFEFQTHTSTINVLYLYKTDILLKKRFEIRLTLGKKSWREGSSNPQTP